ncbi:hypothetical protein ACLOJK_008949 [Asimina triloba]
MDAIRKQLDVLMGANRNGDVREVNRKYYDRDVCRLFLVGLCPHELFQLTVMDPFSLSFRSSPPPRSLARPAGEVSLTGSGPFIRSLGADECAPSNELGWDLFTSPSRPHYHAGVTVKMDLGPCPKVHSLQLRKEYEEAKGKGVDNYDRDLEDVIDRLIVECDRKIQRALKRLEDEDAKAAIAISVSEVTQTLEVLELSKQIKEKLKEADAFDLEGKTDNKIRALEVVEELRGKRADKQSMLLLDAFNKDRASLPQPLPNPPPLAPLPAIAPPDARTQEMINEKLKKAEDLGEQGMVDEAQKALEEAEALKKLGARQEPVLDSSKYTAADVRIDHVVRYNQTDQKLRLQRVTRLVFGVSSPSAFDEAHYTSLLPAGFWAHDRRLADHFGGKLHLGYMQIREKLAELQVLEERNKSRKRSEDDRRSKERSRDHDRAPSKDRERDRDDHGDTRERVRDHDRRSRDRDRYHDRGHERERERESDRPRNYDSRSRRRSRSPRDYDRHRYHKSNWGNDSVHFIRGMTAMIGTEWHLLLAGELEILETGQVLIVDHSTGMENAQNLETWRETGIVHLHIVKILDVLT